MVDPVSFSSKINTAGIMSDVKVNTPSLVAFNTGIRSNDQMKNQLLEVDSNEKLLPDINRARIIAVVNLANSEGWILMEGVITNHDLFPSTSCPTTKTRMRRI